MSHVGIKITLYIQTVTGPIAYIAVESDEVCPFNYFSSRQAETELLCSTWTNVIIRVTHLEKPKCPIFPVNAEFTNSLPKSGKFNKLLSVL